MPFKANFNSLFIHSFSSKCYQKYLLDDKNCDKDLSPSTELKIEEENDECQVLGFNLYYNPEFDVKNKLVTYSDLFYGGNFNKGHIC